MYQTRSHVLPKDDNVKKEPVQNISQYIDRMNGYIETRRDQDCVYVYRGEADIYELPCRPNIFRKRVMEGNCFFEKSLFDSMRQNKLTGETRYLDNAIDAQHGEFPSRLLDVSYNCLTALYFAVTPYYHYPEDFLDDKDGMVFLFFIDEIFSPSARNINENYDAIINRDQEWYQGKVLFEKNHKFIDHTKLNHRIVAQQGAFILFPGDMPESLPEYMGYGLLIPRDAKPRLRRELKDLFGIHTGSIYPEIINLVSEISSKSRKLNTDAFTCINELNYALKRLEKELDYYLDYAIKKKRERTENMEQILVHIEHVIDGYRKGMLEVLRDCAGRKEAVPGREELIQATDRYNRIVGEFSDALAQYGMGAFAGRSLLVELAGGMQA